MKSTLQWVDAYKHFLVVKKRTLIFCTICKCDFKCFKRSQIYHHLKTVEHTENASKHGAGVYINEPEPTNVEFCRDLCQAFTSANIPFGKLNNPTFRNFLKKYCRRSVPAESTLGKDYLGSVFKDKVEKISQQIANQNLWFSVEESTDILNRSIINVVTGVLNSSGPTKPYLISCKMLEKVNAAVISTTIEEAFLKILPQLKPENILFMISEDTPYMLKAGHILKEIFPNLIHLTSLTHTLQGICELVSEEYGHVDRFLNEMRNVFIKNPTQISFYKEQCPHLPLPPQPVVTKWVTWIEAVVFYADNYQAIKNLTDAIDDSEKNIVDCKHLLSMPYFLQQLNFIKITFGHIPQAIKQLETQNLPITESLDLFNRTLEKLKITGEFGRDLKSYILRMKNRNPGLTTIEDISNNIKNHSADIFKKSFSFVPVASCDVERTFPQFKDIVTDKRTAFSDTNLEKYFVICCNKDL